MRVTAGLMLACVAPMAHADALPPDEEVARLEYGAGVAA